MPDRPSTVFLALVLLFLCLSFVSLSNGHWPADAAVGAGPRVLVIYSSGMNNDFRHRAEYDQALAELGWEFRPVQNTAIDQWIDTLSDYDLILTTGLWNTGDPQNLGLYAGKIRAFIENGGIVVFEDMTNPRQINWLPSLGAAYSVKPENTPQEMKGVFQWKSSFLDKPRPGAGGRFWAHFSEWGEAYRVVATDSVGMPVMLVTQMGKGVMLVTTLWGLSAPALANLLDNSVELARGRDFDFIATLMLQTR